MIFCGGKQFHVLPSKQNCDSSVDVAAVSVVCRSQVRTTSFSSKGAKKLNISLPREKSRLMLDACIYLIPLFIEWRKCTFGLDGEG